MKKLENPKWEEKSREYLRNKILPRLQEIQRDIFGKNKIGLEVDVDPEGKYIVCHAYTIMYGKVNKYLHLHLSCVLDREKLESEYENSQTSLRYIQPKMCVATVTHTIIHQKL